VEKSGFRPLRHRSAGPAYQDAGRNCRSFTHTIYVDGRPETARGTACRNPDGTWTSLG
jgi:surface antigen